VLKNLLLEKRNKKPYQFIVNASVGDHDNYNQYIYTRRQQLLGWSTVTLRESKISLNASSMREVPLSMVGSGSI